MSTLCPSPFGVSCSVSLEDAEAVAVVHCLLVESWVRIKCCLKSEVTKLCSALFRGVEQRCLWGKNSHCFKVWLHEIILQTIGCFKLQVVKDALKIVTLKTLNNSRNMMCVF